MSELGDLAIQKLWRKIEELQQENERLRKRVLQLEDEEGPLLPEGTSFKQYASEMQAQIADLTAKLEAAEQSAQNWAQCASDMDEVQADLRERIRTYEGLLREVLALTAPIYWSAPATSKLHDRIRAALPAKTEVKY